MMQKEATVHVILISFFLFFNFSKTSSGWIQMWLLKSWNLKSYFIIYNEHQVYTLVGNIFTSQSAGGTVSLLLLNVFQPVNQTWTHTFSQWRKVQLLLIHTHTHTPQVPLSGGQDPLMETTGFSQLEMKHLPQHITLRERLYERRWVWMHETERNRCQGEFSQYEHFTSQWDK